MLMELSSVFITYHNQATRQKLIAIPLVCKKHTSIKEPSDQASKPRLARHLGKCVIADNIAKPFMTLSPFRIWSITNEKIRQTGTRCRLWTGDEPRKMGRSHLSLFEGERPVMRVARAGRFV